MLAISCDSATLLAAKELRDSSSCFCTPQLEYKNVGEVIGDCRHVEEVQVDSRNVEEAHVGSRVVEVIEA